MTRGIPDRASMPPFEAVLGDAVQALSPAVQAHLLQRDGVREYSGVMRRVWRPEDWRRWLLLPIFHGGALLDLLFPESGLDVPFDLKIVVRTRPDGAQDQEWERLFHFPGRLRRFVDIVSLERRPGSDQPVLLDRLGRGGRIESELFIREEHGGFRMESGAQRLRILDWRMPIPGWLGAQAVVREWERPDGKLEIRAVIRSPLLGIIFRYEGWFAPTGGL
jgi:hypothetical protein